MEAKEFANIRRKMGLTQKQLGEKLRLTQRQIRRYEAAQNELPKYIELSMQALIHLKYPQLAE